MTDWEAHARSELGPKIASSAFIITISPSGDIDPKIALETGYAVLLGKPIVLVSDPEHAPPAGLVRIAHAHVALAEPFGTPAGQQELMAKLGEVDLMRRGRAT